MSQSLVALELANASRLAQRRLRVELAAPSGRMVLARMLVDDELHPALGSLRLTRALTSCRHIGYQLAERVCAKASVAIGRRDRRVRELTVRERHAIAQHLEELPR